MIISANKLLHGLLLSQLPVSDAHVRRNMHNSCEYSDESPETAWQHTPRAMSQCFEYASPHRTTAKELSESIIL